MELICSLLELLIINLMEAIPLGDITEVYTGLFISP